MKINEPKVLKAILNKTKVKDIRKAYGYCTDCGEDCDINSCGMQISQGMIDKPPKYEVGDIVEIIWTGDEILLKDGVEYGWIKHNQILAKVKIISREKIEIKKDFERYNNTIGHGNGWEIRFLDWGKDHIIPINDDYFSRTYNLAKEEGFDSVEEMFEWLESYAGDLSTSKPFWLYGLEYIEGGK